MRSGIPRRAEFGRPEKRFARRPPPTATLRGSRCRLDSRRGRESRSTSRLILDPRHPIDEECGDGEPNTAIAGLHRFQDLAASACSGVRNRMARRVALRAGRRRRRSRRRPVASSCDPGRRGSAVRRGPGGKFRAVVVDDVEIDLAARYLVGTAWRRPGRWPGPGNGSPGGQARDHGRSRNSSAGDDAGRSGPRPSRAGTGRRAGRRTGRARRGAPGRPCGTHRPPPRRPDGPRRRGKRERDLGVGTVVADRGRRGGGGTGSSARSRRGPGGP